MADQSKSEIYSPAETEARREAALKTMFATPHKPYKPQQATNKGNKESREK